MRYTFCLAIVLLTGVSLFGQRTTSQQFSLKEQYLQKSKSKKRTGWILLGTGAAMMGGGMAFFEAKKKTHDLVGLAGLAAAGAGFGLSIGSGFCFSAADRYKRKAAALSFHFEKISKPYQQGFVQSSVPTVKLKITL